MNNYIPQQQSQTQQINTQGRETAMQDRIATALEWFWDLIDISENLKRMTEVVKKQPVDSWFVWAHIVGYASAAVICGWMAWTFDIQSTYNALEVTRDFSAIQAGLKGYPEDLSKLTLGSVTLLLITLAPTIMEIFGAAFAKAKIGILQLLVVALSIFDVVTDIPTCSLYLLAHKPYFDTLGFWSNIAYPIAYVGWLFMSTFGWELATLIFGWAAIALLIRLLAANERPQQRR